VNAVAVELGDQGAGAAVLAWELAGKQHGSFKVHGRARDGTAMRLTVVP
jgi:hypothetical protein